MVYLCITTAVSYWSCHHPASVNNRSPRLLMLNYTHILVRTNHCGIHLTYVLALPSSYIGKSYHVYRTYLNDGVELLLVIIESFVTSG